ncbi:NAD(P)-dependent oxidoreductase [Aeromicrobium duanguangcaii]|uniref:Dihydrofolate reductase n=1 Tax=Aeromicrobium duanguangcaii TaxID=2968086 RepID=A0ABY5KLF0_9ACTN|nr:NAD(P)-dependent oxidoreductase [Aeromicrobium duanguangcaii]MCD9153779.1 dihydrofolate reductase [Aeromicrobium duanguangcaii]MCL3836236.1 dihydrofolate reductase [Aeromicrobium duanguangcaii]UUI69143.1 dihydrofolate reductase [Aeromicrobium duanguangcaii]
MMRISVPDESWLAALSDLDVDVVVWDGASEQPEGRLDLVVWPYTLAPTDLAAIDASRIGLVQGQALGYDGVADLLPAGGRYANAVGVHEDSTAELAVTLLLAAARNLDVFASRQTQGLWRKKWSSSLLDRRVMLLGVGGIGARVATRLDGFGCELVRVGSRARDDESGHVHGTDELDELLPTVDAVVVAVPLTPATERMIDADFLARLPDGAIVVNVARGRTADTEAVLAEAGRLRYAADVFDPEPLPPDHPLWSAPGVIITPHVGGMTSAMAPRIHAVVRGQIERLAAGEKPAHVVVDHRAGS